MEVEEALAIALTDGRGKEESEEALFVSRMRMAKEASEEPEGSHFDGVQERGAVSVFSEGITACPTQRRVQKYFQGRRHGRYQRSASCVRE